MENASKALLIAGSVLIALLVISLLVYFYNNFIIPEGIRTQSREVESASDFNAPYEAYNRPTIYGSEMLSLCNLMDNYNVQEGYSKSFRYITVNITFNTNFTIDDTLYTTNNSNNNTTREILQKKVYKNGHYNSDGKYIYGDFTNTMNDLENEILIRGYMPQYNQDNDTIGVTKEIKNALNKINDNNTKSKLQSVLNSTDMRNFREAFGKDLCPTVQQLSLMRTSQIYGLYLQAIKTGKHTVANSKDYEEKTIDELPASDTAIIQNYYEKYVTSYVSLKSILTTIKGTKFKIDDVKYDLEDGNNTGRIIEMDYTYIGNSEE